MPKLKTPKCPTKPNPPYKPAKPIKKLIQTKQCLFDKYIKYNINEFSNLIKDNSRISDISNIKFSFEVDEDNYGGCSTLYIIIDDCEMDNVNYDTLYKKYLSYTKEYDLKYKRYKIKLKKYKEELKKYQENAKLFQLEQARNTVSLLENQLRNLK